MPRLATTLLLLVAAGTAFFAPPAAQAAPARDGPSLIRPIPPHPAPSLLFYDSSNQAMRLQDFMRTKAKDLPIVVIFWARWCESCRADLARWDQLARAAQGRIAVLSIASEDDSHGQLPAFFKRYAVRSLPPYWHSGYDVMADWSIDGVPALFLIDPNGTVRARMAPAWQDSDIPALIDALVAAGQTPAP